MRLENRQKDWYNAERRFIFACATDKEAKDWMNLINSENIKLKLQKGVLFSLMRPGQ
jgi:hypothetical protein